MFGGFDDIVGPFVQDLFQTRVAKTPRMMMRALQSPHFSGWSPARVAPSHQPSGVKETSSEPWRRAEMFQSSCYIWCYMVLVDVKAAKVPLQRHLFRTAGVRSPDPDTDQAETFVRATAHRLARCGGGQCDLPWSVTVDQIGTDSNMSRALRECDPEDIWRSRGFMMLHDALWTSWRALWTSWRYVKIRETSSWSANDVNWMPKGWMIMAERFGRACSGVKKEQRQQQHNGLSGHHLETLNVCLVRQASEHCVLALGFGKFS